MFHEIQIIAQEYGNVHPTRRIEKTKFVQIQEKMEKIGVASKPREPYHHKIQEYNDLNYKQSNGSASDKIPVQHEGIFKV